MYSNRLKYFRERNGITQMQMAKLIQVGKSQYSLYENEKVTIPIKHLNTLCNYFHTSLDYIFEFTNIKNYPKNNLEINKKISSKRLKDFREDNKLSQTALANFLNTTFSTISSYEREVNIISTSYLYAICSKYHLSADYLLGKTEEPIYFNK